MLTSRTTTTTKQSATSTTKRSVKKKTASDSEMFRSPSNNKGGGKGAFRLDPPTLLLGDTEGADDATGQAAITSNNVQLEKEVPQTASKQDMQDDDDVFTEVDTPVAVGGGASAAPAGAVPAGPVPAGTQALPLDPLAQLQALMLANFATMKNDNQAMSGQLGVLQSNVASVNNTVDTLKSEMEGISNKLTDVTAQVVTNKCSINELKKKMNNIQQEQKETIEKTVAASVTREIQKVKIPEIPNHINQQLDKMSKELDKLRAVQTVQSMANNQREALQTSRPSFGSGESDERQYWEARRKLRCSPIGGPGCSDLLADTHHFLSQILAIPEGELHDSAVSEVRRVPGRKRGFNMNEAIITFDSVQTRDCVASYASNLSEYRGGDNSRRANLRLEIPDFLCGAFRVLERCAHNLKAANPSFFRRSIKYDDVNLSLVLDYCVEEGGNWSRIDYAEAAEMTRGKRGSSARTSASSSSGAPEGMSGVPGPSQRDSQN